MKAILTLLLLGAFTLTGCFNTEQDPLADQSAEVKAGTPPAGAEKPKEKPLSGDVLKIDGPEFFVFHEGEDQEINLSARSLFEDSTYRLEIVNEQDFEGMQVTAVDGDTVANQNATLNIKWKVPKGVAGENVNELKLDAIVYTTNLSETYSYKRSFSILVYSQSQGFPIVTKIVTPGTAIKENTSSTFKVYVTDNDAIDMNGSRPALYIMPDTTGNVNATGFMVPKQAVKDPAVPNGWVFDVAVNFTNAEFTTNTASTKFFVSAVSRFGRMSNPAAGSFQIWTSVAQPISSWTEPVTFTREQINSYTFSVTDPKGEGQITANFLTSCGSLEGAPTCTCKSVLGFNGKSSGAAQCTIKWTPPAGGWFSSNSFKFDVSVTNQSPISGDKDKQTATLSGTIYLN